MPTTRYPDTLRQQAIALYREDDKTWNRLVRRAMGGKYGWDQSAKVYLNVYRSLFEEKA